MGFMDKLKGLFGKGETDDGKKKKKKKDDEEESKGIVLSEKTMKIVTLLVLLVSDFDFLLTIISCMSYVFAAGIFYVFLALIGCFFMIYIGGCVIAARESTKFLERFKEKVESNEIAGISMEDLNAALEGARIFWQGTVFEEWKKRKQCLQAMRLNCPDTLDATQMTDDDVNMLEAALKEAEISGLALLKKKAPATQFKERFDANYGQNEIEKYATKLDLAKKTLAAKKGTGKSERHLPLAPMTNKTSDQIMGDSAGGGAPPSVPLEQEEEEEIDPEIKAFHKEIDEARDPPKDKKGNPTGPPDDALALNLEKAMRGELDTFRVPPKLLNAEGKCMDEGRALYMVCEAKSLLHAYHQTNRQFSRRIVKVAHSAPFYRLMEFGWQPSVSHSDFAGILNANGLYSFTVGIPQLMFAIAFLASQGTPVEFLCAAKDPNMLAVEGCPDPSWANCTYIPPAECRTEYETCNKYVVQSGPAAGEPCDPTAVDDCKTGDCTATETCDPERYLGNGKCSTLEDFQKQTVQTVLISCSFAIGIFSTVLSLANIILDFPAQLFDIAEKEEEALHFTLQAEDATKQWEDKLQAEVQENVRQRLKNTKYYPKDDEEMTERVKKGTLKKGEVVNPIAPNEAPSLVINGVVELEKEVMQKRVGYIEHFMMMSEEEKSRRDALRHGKKPPVEEEEDSDDEAPKKEKSTAAPREVKIKGDTKLVITEKSKRTLDRVRSEGAALSTDEAAAAAAPAEALEEDAA